MCLFEGWLYYAEPDFDGVEWLLEPVLQGFVEHNYITVFRFIATIVELVDEGCNACASGSIILLEEGSME